MIVRIFCSPASGGHHAGTLIQPDNERLFQNEKQYLMSKTLKNPSKTTRWQARSTGTGGHNRSIIVLVALRQTRPTRLSGRAQGNRI